LNNISASSASIERFFSVCGFVSRQPALNMRDDLLINRCLLKSNLEILKELKDEIE
jgi:hypothetical protein